MGTRRGRNSPLQPLRHSGRTPETPHLRVWVWAFTLACMICGAASGVCPRGCECKWKDGKETVACIKADFNVIPRNLDPSTQVLDLQYNNLKVLRKDAFVDTGLVNLQKLWLNYCNLQRMERGAFNMLANLVELDLSHNLLQVVPTAALCDVPGLRDLRLASNALTSLPDDAFSATPELVRLDLSNNSIYSLEDNAFRGLASLEVLKLTDNRLVHISQEVLVPLMALHGLHLNENPWRCDCSLRPLRHWMIDHKIAGIVPPTCARPRRISSRSWHTLSLREFACAPEISAITPRVMGSSEESVSLACRLEGDVEANVSWFHGEKRYKVRYKVRDSVFNNTAKVSNLTIGKVRAKDQGVYWCVAQNKAGRAEANVTLEVSNEISEFRLVAINPAYMTGGLLSGLGFLVTVLLLVSCIIHRRQRVRRFRRQEEDREGREMLAQSSMSRGSSVMAQPEVADYHPVPSGDLDDAPLHPLQAKQSYIGRGAANGHYARDNYTDKIQRYSDAVSDSRRYKDDLDVDLRLSPSTVSYVDLASNELARTRSDLGEKMSLKNLEHETDILRRECSPTGSIVSMISNGPYPDLLDLPYIRRHEEYQQGFHSLNSNLGSITRKPSLYHYADRHRDFPSYNRSSLSARCYSDLNLTMGEAASHASVHPRLRRISTRHPSLPTTPMPDAEDTPIMHAHDARRLRRRMAMNRGGYHSLEGAGDLSISNPYRYQFRSARLEKFLQEHRSLQEHLYRSKGSRDAVIRAGSSSRLPTYLGSLDTARGTSHYGEPSSTCSSPYLDVELGVPQTRGLAPESIVGLGGLAHRDAHRELRQSRSLSSADPLIDSLSSRTLATPDSIMDVLQGRSLSPTETVIDAVRGRTLGPSESVVDVIKGRSLGSSESMREVAKGRALDTNEVIRDAMHRRSLERGDSMVDAMHRRSMDRGESVMEMMQSRSLAQSDPIADAMQRSLDRGDAMVDALHRRSFDHSDAVVDAIHRRSLDRGESVADVIHARSLAQSDSMSDVIPGDTQRQPEPLRSILKNRYEGGGLLYQGQYSNSAYGDERKGLADTAYSPPDYKDYLDS
ncbi:uncharacterized protein LOC122251484 [Penaeus japonicus]|uniref:uncharacterized protein LOC122251484 n=1 Tax=Penaeus japonicus TaxID=27405 RepID=UPI001C714C0A|nr:uncharacterized protein LOC122251484 [Penaeus japonicus]XP_042869411.1 uncharacterized protein LOC122251484 [Penaeus japonicus]